MKLQVPERKITINFKGRLISLETPIVMGIINATPDSFYSNSRTQTLQQAIDQAGKMLAEGATILDVGGYSSRPGATHISEQEEADRVLPVIEAIHQHHPNAIISVDTFRAKIARLAVKSGAVAVNDISAGDDDAEMIATVAQLKVPYFIMHKQGTPQTMQINPQYNDVVLDIMHYFSSKIAKLRAAGIADVIIDPGFGFCKTLEHNYALLRALNDFSIFGLPVLVGVSRKSMIQKVLYTNTEESLNGTTVLHTVALLKGANILRVHDVKEAVQCIKLIETLNGKTT